MTETYYLNVSRSSTSGSIETNSFIPKALIDLNISLSLSTVPYIVDEGYWYSPCDTCDEIWVGNLVTYYHYSSCRVTINVYSNASSTPFFTQNYDLSPSVPSINTTESFEAPNGTAYRVEYVLSNESYYNSSVYFNNNQIVCSFNE